jgi:hypothetical protein
MVEGAHVDHDDVGPEAVATVTAAYNSKAEPTLQTKPDHLVKMLDLCWLDDSDGVVEECLAVLDDPVALRHGNLVGQCRQRAGAA